MISAVPTTYYFRNRAKYEGVNSNNIAMGHIFFPSEYFLIEFGDKTLFTQSIGSKIELS